MRYNEMLFHDLHHAFPNAVGALSQRGRFHSWDKVHDAAVEATKRHGTQTIQSIEREPEAVKMWRQTHTFVKTLVLGIHNFFALPFCTDFDQPTVWTKPSIVIKVVMAGSVSKNSQTFVPYLPKGGGPHCLVLCVKNLHLQREVLCFLYGNDTFSRTFASCATDMSCYRPSLFQRMSIDAGHETGWVLWIPAAFDPSLRGQVVIQAFSCCRWLSWSSLFLFPEMQQTLGCVSIVLGCEWGI